MIQRIAIVCVKCNVIDLICIIYKKYIIYTSYNSYTSVYISLCVFKSRCLVSHICSWPISLLVKWDWLMLVNPLAFIHLQYVYTMHLTVIAYRCFCRYVYGIVYLSLYMCYFALSDAFWSNHLLRKILWRSLRVQVMKAPDTNSRQANSVKFVCRNCNLQISRAPLLHRDVACEQ